MRLSASVLLIYFFLLIPTVNFADSTDNTYPVKIHKYNDHLYKLSVEYSFPFSNLLYVGEKSLLLVDTGFDRTPESILKAIRTISDLPIKYVLISHTHVDHIGGINVLGKDALVFVNKDGLYSEFPGLGKYPRFKQNIVTVNDTLELHFDGEIIRMITLPKGHGTDEMIIHFVNSNILYTGSRVLPGNYIYVEQDGGGTIDEVLDRIKLIAEEYNGVKIVPAHYYDVDTDYLIKYHDALVSTRQEVNKHLDKGETVEEIVEAKVFEPWDSLGHSYYNHAEWIKAIARERGIVAETLPSIFEPIAKILEKDGREAMSSAYWDLKKSEPDKYNYDVNQLYAFGYELLARERVDDALEVFYLNMKAHPDSKYTYRCYGDVLVMKGEKKKALKIYEKALEIDPEYKLVLDSVERLKSMKD